MGKKHEQWEENGWARSMNSERRTDGQEAWTVRGERMGKKHEQWEENRWAASKVGRKKKKKEKVGRWREEEIRVLGQELGF
jgi:hypothetical protein